MSDRGVILEARAVKKTYTDGMVEALKGVDLKVLEGEFVCVMGHSGSGKSTLLHLLGSIDKPTSGEILIDGKRVNELGPLNLFRAKNIGFVFQFHHLLSQMTVLQNVTAPLVPTGMGKEAMEERARELLTSLGLADRMNFLPSRISGGERQRVAMARALANSPRIVLADEPTGQLDEETAKTVVAFLLKRCRMAGTTLLLATHNSELSLLADRVIRLRSGLIDEL